LSILIVHRRGAKDAEEIIFPFAVERTAKRKKLSPAGKSFFAYQYRLAEG